MNSCIVKLACHRSACAEAESGKSWNSGCCGCADNDTVHDLESRLVGMGDDPLKDESNGVHYRHVHLTRRVRLMMPNPIEGVDAFVTLWMVSWASRLSVMWGGVKLK